MQMRLVEYMLMKVTLIIVKINWNQRMKRNGLFLRRCMISHMEVTLGMNRTYDRMKLFTTWPGMKQELEEHIRQCETC